MPLNTYLRFRDQAFRASSHAFASRPRKGAGGPWCGRPLAPAHRRPCGSACLRTQRGHAVARGDPRPFWRTPQPKPGAHTLGVGAAGYPASADPATRYRQRRFPSARATGGRRDYPLRTAWSRRSRMDAAGSAPCSALVGPVADVRGLAPGASSVAGSHDGAWVACVAAKATDRCCGIRARPSRPASPRW